MTPLHFQYTAWPSNDVPAEIVRRPPRSPSAVGVRGVSRYFGYITGDSSKKIKKKKIIWICQLHSPFYRKPSGRLLSHTVLFLHTSTIKSYKGGLIPEDISTMVSSTTKSAKSLKENLNKVFTVIGEKLKFPAQESDLAPFVGNGTKVKIPYEIKPPLVFLLGNIY